MGKRTRQVPEEVSKKLGQANLLYATERCALLGWPDPFQCLMLIRC